MHLKKQERNTAIESPFSISSCEAAFQSGFSSCVYANFKDDVERLRQEFLSLSLRRRHESNGNMDQSKQIHHSSMNAGTLLEVESLLTSEGMYKDPVIVIATFGLGHVIYLRKVGSARHYSCPGSLTRIVQEWGRSGRGNRVSSFCMTFYSREEMNGLRQIAEEGSRNVATSPPFPDLRELVSKGIRLSQELLNSRRSSDDHIKLTDYESTKLSRWASLWLRVPTLTSSAISFYQKWTAMELLTEKAMPFCPNFPKLSFFYQKATTRFHASNDTLSKAFLQTRSIIMEDVGQNDEDKSSFISIHLTRTAEKYLRELFTIELDRLEKK